MLAKIFISKWSIYFQKNPNSKLNPSLFFSYFNDRRFRSLSSDPSNQNNNETVKQTTTKSNKYNNNTGNISPQNIPQVISLSSLQLQSNVVLMKKEFEEAVTFRQLLDVFNKYQSELLNEEKKKKKKKTFEIINFSSKLHRDQTAELSKEELSQLEYYLGLYHPESVKIAFSQEAMHRLPKDEIVKSAEDLGEKNSKLWMTRKDLEYFLRENQKDQLVRLLRQTTLSTSSFADYCDFIDLVIRSIEFVNRHEIQAAMQLILPHLMEFEDGIEQISIQEASRFIMRVDCIPIWKFPDSPYKAVYVKLLFRMLEDYYNPNPGLTGIIHRILFQLDRFEINKQSLSLHQIDCIWTGIKLDFQKLKSNQQRLEIVVYLGSMGFQYPDDLRKDLWDIVTAQSVEGLFREQHSTFDNLSAMLVSFHRINYMWTDMPKELKENVFILLNRSINDAEMTQRIAGANFAGSLNYMFNLGITGKEIPADTQSNILKFTSLKLEEDPVQNVNVLFAVERLGLTIPEKIKASLISQSIEFIEKRKDEIWQRSEWRTVKAFIKIFPNLSFYWKINEDINAILLKQGLRYINSTSFNAFLATNIYTFELIYMKWTAFPQETLDKLWMTIERYLNKPKTEENHLLFEEVYSALSLMNSTFYTFQSSYESVLQRFESNPKLFGLIFAGLGQKTNWKLLENRKKILQLVHGQLEGKNKDSDFDFVLSKIITGLTLMTFDFFLDGPLTAEDKEEFIQIHRPIVQIICSVCLRDNNNKISDDLRRAIAEYLDWLRTVPRSLREPLLQAAGQKEIPEMNVSKEIQTTWKKEIASFGEDLLSYLGKEAALDAGTTGYDSNKSISFEVIPHYQGLPGGILSMPLAVKFNNEVLAFIIFVDEITFPSGESLPSRDTSLVEYVYGYYHEVGVFRVVSETIFTPEYREDQIKAISDELFNLKKKII